ncbi:MAG TPA: hypothetical protein VH740_14265 [Vicinamibacterales bacterium]|jgi:hypothetical protein
MKYSTPELVVLGSAANLVLGKPRGEDDSADPKEFQPGLGVVLGLDD